MEKNLSRRSFVEKTAVAGAVIAAGSKMAKAQTKNKPSTELLSIGVIALGDNSHMNYSIWAPTINPTEPNVWPVGRTTGMQITHCWDMKPELREAFAKKYNCAAVKNYSDMVGKVDGMIFAGFNEVKWWPKLAKPYLEAGIPCYLNRPFAYSMKDAHEIVDTAKKNNTPILCTDEREYIQQALVARAKVAEWLKEGRVVVGANGDNSAGNEYPQHGVHGLYFMLAILGLDVDMASLQADGWWREKTKTAANPQTWAQITLKYNGIEIPDAGKQTVPFVASQHQTGASGDASIRLYYGGKGRGCWDIAHPWTSGYERVYYLFFPTILAMQRMFETRKMQWSYDYILKKTQIFLTAFKSHLEHNGSLIKVADLPENWEAPCPYPDAIDEAIFK
jgi:predicted dehydrogenase